MTAARHDAEISKRADDAARQAPVTLAPQTSRQRAVRGYAVEQPCV